MSEDERRIRALITRWADAVHRGDLEAVLADHAEDLRLYYVTPPQPPTAAAQDRGSPAERG